MDNSLPPCEVFSLLYPVTIAASCLNHSQDRSIISPPAADLQANASVSVPVQSHRSEGSRALWANDPWENRNFQQNNYKKETVDVWVNERERTGDRWNVCVKVFASDGESQKKAKTRRGLEHMKVIKSVRKRAFQRSDTGVWERKEKERTAAEEQQGGKRRSWTALWQLRRIPRRITRALDATNCQQEASSS